MTTRRLAEVRRPGEPPQLLQHAHMCATWYLTTYTACDLRCSYCITYAQGPSMPAVAREHLTEQLGRELEDLPEHATICIGGFVDGYPHAEANHGVTRLALAELVRRRRDVNIVTKGTTVERDLDLIRAGDVGVAVSVLSADDRVTARLEPHTPPPTTRLALVERLHRAGVSVTLNVAPWLPGVTDLVELLDAVGPEVAVVVGPANVQSPLVRNVPALRGLDQRSASAAYVAEHRRIGRRPNVRWVAPGYLGDELLAELRAAGRRHGGRERPSPADPEVVAAQARWWAVPAPAGAGSRAERNATTIERLVRALDHRALPLVVGEVVSPYLRIHDETGLSRDPDHPRSGAVTDALGECARCVDGPRTHIASLEATETTVTVRVLIEGTLVHDLLGHEARGQRVRISLEDSYRLDQHALVVERTQHRIDVADLAHPARPARGSDAAPAATKGPDAVNGSDGAPPSPGR